MDGGNSIKRSRDEFERGSNQQGEFDNKKQHVDPAIELIANVCKDIRRIGENTNLASQVDDISYISNPIVAEFEKIDKLRMAILNTFYAIVIQQPQKISALTALVLICNAKNFLVSKYVVEFFNSKAQEMLDGIVNKDGDEANEQERASSVEVEEDAGVFNNLKSILKFISSLSPIIEVESIINIYKSCFNLAIDLQKSSVGRSGTAEQIYYNTLLSVPYLLSYDYSEKMIETCNMLVEIGEKFEVPNSQDLSILYPFESRGGNFEDELPYKPTDMVCAIMPAIKSAQGDAKNWKVISDKLFLNFGELISPIIEASLQANTISNEIVKHNFAQLALPSLDILKVYEPTGLVDRAWAEHPRLMLEVYNTSTEFETVPPHTTIYGLIFKDLAFDILTNLSFNKNEAAIQLSILDLYFAKNLFAPPGSSIDQLTMIHNDNKAGENIPPLSTWKIEDVAVESILSMIFQLPKASNREIYYYTILISCCKESPDSIAPVFGRAIRYFYNNLKTLDSELRNRFMDWMSIQISNFDFSWKWDEWVKDSKKFKNLNYHPKKLFVKNLIAKEVRLSNKNRIKESFVGMNPDQESDDQFLLLDEFYQYLDISLFSNVSGYFINYDSKLYGNTDAVKETLAKIEFERKEKLSEKSSASFQEEISFVFTNSDLPLHEIANLVYSFITANWKSNKEFSELYNDVDKKLEEFPEIDPECFKINLFFQTYAFIGSRSIFSVVSLLSRDLLKLKYISGVKIPDAAYKADDFQFPPRELSDELRNNVQDWIIESIMRIWMHHPQVMFLMLEYLIEFEILKPENLIKKSLQIETNLMVKNVACMESVSRILFKCIENSQEHGKTVLLDLFTKIVNNLNIISDRLEIVNSEKIKIEDFDDEAIEDTSRMSKIDDQWLYYEYIGLVRYLLRSFVLRFSDASHEFEDLIKGISNEFIQSEILGYVVQLKI